jgi:hypothetical protein
MSDTVALKNGKAVCSSRDAPKERAQGGRKQRQWTGAPDTADVLEVVTQPLADMRSTARGIFYLGCLTEMGR